MPPIMKTNHGELWIFQISPVIWRRVLVRSNSTTAERQYMLHIAYGWSDELQRMFPFQSWPSERRYQQLDAR
jgi:hypothetical protein